MTEIKVQETIVRDGNMEIFIADSPGIEEATEWVNFSVKVSADQHDNFLRCQTVALQRLRDIIGHEIKMRTTG